jgi:hypothetical protein
MVNPVDTVQPVSRVGGAFRRPLPAPSGPWGRCAIGYSPRPAVVALFVKDFGFVKA